MQLIMLELLAQEAIANLLKTAITDTKVLRHYLLSGIRWKPYSITHEMIG